MTHTAKRECAGFYRYRGHDLMREFNEDYGWSWHILPSDGSVHHNDPVNTLAMAKYSVDCIIDGE